jgi:hypothetical protein
MKGRLQKRARASGRSLSEEAKVLLRKALSVPELPAQNLWDWMRNAAPPQYRGDDFVFEVKDYPRPAKFE